MVKPKPFNWASAPYSSGFRAEMPGDVTLVASPDCTTGFSGKPARGTFWRAQATHWNESTSTASRFGRDEYDRRHKTAKEAMRAAESIYRDAIAAAEFERRAVDLDSAALDDLRIDAEQAERQAVEGPFYPERGITGESLLIYAAKCRATIERYREWRSPRGGPDRGAPRAPTRRSRLP